MKIDVQDLHFTYPGDIKALTGISVSIEPGEKVAIVGQNGAGKTTLVKHFNGLLKPSTGSVLVGGWDTRDYTVAKLAARVGYVFQNPDDQLFSRTVRQEVYVGPDNLGYSPERAEQLVDYALKLTGLTAEQETNPYDLSPTWRKMVALASVIAMDTPVLVFDEPTTGQDSASLARIAGIVNLLHQRGKTIITISHDIDFCADHFDRIIALGKGKLLLDGAVQEVIVEEQILAETYVDLPQLTRLARRLGFPGSVYTEDEFLAVYRQWRGEY